MTDMTIAELIDGYDGYSSHDGQAHFDRGVGTAGDMERISIAVNNVWSGRSKDGASVSSYEKIGYHAGSVDFIRGVLAADCPVYVYRWDGQLIKYNLVA